MEHVWNSLAGGLTEPLVEIGTSATSRLYWPFIVIGLLIACVIYTRRHGGTAFYDYLFSRDTWLSPSARNDYAVIFINPVILLLVSSWLFVNGEALTGLIASFLSALGLGGEAGSLGQTLLGFALTVTLFVVDDFIRWFGHYLHHRIPFLWEFHKVHHSAEVLNFITAERFHPVELLIMSALGATSVALVNGVFIGLWGNQLSVVTLAGANVFWVFANIIGGVLRHSPFWVSFGPKVERWLVSPAMHHIHHSDDPRHYDRNLGGTLAVWDRWFGTIYIPEAEEKLTYGIGPETREFRPLTAIYLRPLKNAAAMLIPSRTASGDKPGSDPAA